MNFEKVTLNRELRSTRKQTEKFAQYQEQKKRKEPLIPAKAADEDSDEYILKLVQQQSKQSRQSRKGKSAQKTELINKIHVDTANSTPDEKRNASKDLLDNSDEDMNIEDLDDILEQSGNRFMKNK